MFYKFPLRFVFPSLLRISLSLNLFRAYLYALVRIKTLKLIVKSTTRLNKNLRPGLSFSEITPPPTSCGTSLRSRAYLDDEDIFAFFGIGVCRIVRVSACTSPVTLSVAARIMTDLPYSILNDAGFCLSLIEPSGNIQR